MAFTVSSTTRQSDIVSAVTTTFSPGLMGKNSSTIFLPTPPSSIQYHSRVGSNALSSSMLYLPTLLTPILRLSAGTYHAPIPIDRLLVEDKSRGGAKA